MTQSSPKQTYLSFEEVKSGIARVRESVERVKVGLKEVNRGVDELQAKMEAHKHMRALRGRLEKKGP